MKKKVGYKSSSGSMDPVEVYARIKPILEEIPTCLKAVNNKVLQLVSQANKITECHFNHLFKENASQGEVFELVAKPMVEDLLIGKSGLLFTYGVTSSGKTYTMMGNRQNSGLLMHSLDMIFHVISSVQASRNIFIADDLNGFEVQPLRVSMFPVQEKLLSSSSNLTNQEMVENTSSSENIMFEKCSTDLVNKHCRYAIFVSFVEIYNDYIYDLLSEIQLDSFNKPKQPQSKRLREDKYRNMFVYGVSQVEVKNASEALAEFQRGQDRRRIAQTHLNAESSRSHSIFTIRLVQAPLDPLGEDILQERSLIKVSQIALVDLAGSERLKRTGAEGDRLKEAGNINNSLMTLRRCFEQLRENQKSKSNQMVKYRNSKLTHLFKSYFEGHGKVKMIVCLNPCVKEYDENVQVVQFAEVAQQVEVASPEEFKLDYDSVKKKAAEIRKKQEDQRKQKLTAAWQLSLNKSDSADENMVAKSKHSSDIESESVPSCHGYLDFPNFDVMDCADDETLSNLITFLENRVAFSSSIEDSALNMEIFFKANIEKHLKKNECFDLKVRKNSQEVIQKNKSIAKLENQVKKLELKNQALTKNVRISDQNKKQLQSQLGSTEAQLKASNFECQKVNLKLKDAVENVRTKIEKQCEKKVWHVQTELKEKILKKEEHLQQLKNIVSQCDSREGRSRVRKPLTSLTSYSSSQTGKQRKTSFKRRSRSAENLLSNKEIHSLYSSKCNSIPDQVIVADKIQNVVAVSRKRKSDVNNENVYEEQSNLEFTSINKRRK